MQRHEYTCFTTIPLILILLVAPLLAATEEDLCREEGIIVRNATMLDLWYRKNGGQCSIWIHEHLFTIKPGDSVNIFSDLNCQSLYCANNPTYKVYKSVDVTGDCRVKILPNCTLSDM
jgi:hypothetical protein